MFGQTLDHDIWEYIAFSKIFPTFHILGASQSRNSGQSQPKVRYDDDAQLRYDVNDINRRSEVGHQCRSEVGHSRRSEVWGRAWTKLLDSEAPGIGNVAKILEKKNNVFPNILIQCWAEQFPNLNSVGDHY